MNRADQLDQIRTEIIDCNVCPNLAKTAKQLVFGDGNPEAEILFIGEAPGKKEDELGLPFVGASGKFLNDLLNSINLDRQQVYITNIVKYRPPNNRDPSKEEKLAFLPYLKRQIEIIQPIVIVTLGRHSLNSLILGPKIGDQHGKPLDYDGRVLLPLFHPAAALYNGSLRETLVDDFQNIPNIINNIKKEINF